MGPRPSLSPECDDSGLRRAPCQRNAHPAVETIRVDAKNPKPGAGIRQADRELARMAAEVSQGRSFTAAERVGELLDMFLEHVEAADRSPTTLWKYRSTAEMVLRPELGRKKLTKLSAGLPAIEQCVEVGPYPIKEPRRRDKEPLPVVPGVITPIRRTHERRIGEPWAWEATLLCSALGRVGARPGTPSMSGGVLAVPKLGCPRLPLWSTHLRGAESAVSRTSRHTLAYFMSWSCNAARLSDHCHYRRRSSLLISVSRAST